MELTKDNYFSTEANNEYCSASQYKDIIGFPVIPGCESRALARLRGEYEEEQSKALLIGSILDAFWEGVRGDELTELFPDCISTRGATKGQLKAEYQQAIQLYERTYKDEKFRQYMEGDKQTIMTGEIEGLKFKIKMDSFDGRRITDLKTTENADQDFRIYVKDSGEKLPFYLAWGYDTQLAIYREIARQNTGEIYPCYIAAVDKKPHPKPVLIYMEPQLLDDALESVRQNCNRIILLKSGEIEPSRCESDKCNYCRDTYECSVISTSEFEAHDIPRDAT